MSGKLHKIVEAWIKAMEDAQPAYGELLQSTVDAVGPLPALEENGKIRTIKDGANFWYASGLTKSYASKSIDSKRIHLLGNDYKRYEQQGDEEAMALAWEKARFYKSLSAWVEGTEPRQSRMKEIPSWFAPFVSKKETAGQGAGDSVP